VPHTGAGLTSRLCDANFGKGMRFDKMLSEDIEELRQFLDTQRKRLIDANVSVHNGLIHCVKRTGHRATSDGRPLRLVLQWRIGLLNAREKEVISSNSSDFLHRDSSTAALAASRAAALSQVLKATGLS
jgi:hypothetical protein